MKPPIQKDSLRQFAANCSAVCTQPANWNSNDSGRNGRYKSFAGTQRNQPRDTQRIGCLVSQPSTVWILPFGSACAMVQADAHSVILVGLSALS